MAPASSSSESQPLCELCQAEVAHSFHHLIPRTNHSNKWFKKRFTREEMRRGLNLCRDCHRAIHDLIPDEKQLGRYYNTRARLMDHPRVAAYVRWKRAR